MLVRAATHFATIPSRSFSFVYLFAALLFGTLGALAKGFDTTTAEGLGATCGPLLLGLAVGAVRRLFGPVNIARWAFWVWPGSFRCSRWRFRRCTKHVRQSAWSSAVVF